MGPFQVRLWTTDLLLPLRTVEETGGLRRGGFDRLCVARPGPAHTKRYPGLAQDEIRGIEIDRHERPGDRSGPTGFAREAEPDPPRVGRVELQLELHLLRCGLHGKSRLAGLRDGGIRDMRRHQDGGALDPAAAKIVERLIGLRQRIDRRFAS